MSDPDFDTKMRLELASTDYVAAVATNFEHRNWDSPLDRLEREGGAWLAEDCLRPSLDRTPDPTEADRSGRRMHGEWRR